MSIRIESEEKNSLGVKTGQCDGLEGESCEGAGDGKEFVEVSVGGEIMVLLDVVGPVEVGAVKVGGAGGGEVD